MSTYQLTKVKQEDRNKHKNPASFRVQGRIITSGLSFQGEVNQGMDVMERTQARLEVSIAQRELATKEEEQKAAERGNIRACVFLSLQLCEATLLCADTVEGRTWFH